MIKLEHVKKSFGDQAILRDISLNVPTGSVTVILGPSGSGKTTLLRTINFLGKADGGTLFINDQRYDLRKASRKEILAVRRQMAMVFQSYNLFSNMTALQNVMEALVTVQGRNKADARERAAELLTQVGMKEHADKYPAQLSGGQQQRVGIARALAVNPQVILFDEPTSALDPELVGEVLAVIRDVAKNSKVTMIIVTHEIAFAREVADQIVFMEGGCVVETGAPQDVLVYPREKRTRVFLNRYLGGTTLRDGAGI